MSTDRLPRIGFLLLIFSLGALAQLGDQSLSSVPNSMTQGFASQLAQLRVAKTYAAYLGTSVAVGGNTVVVGTPFGGTTTSTAFLYVEPLSGWNNMTQTALLMPSDGGNDFDNFGASVAVSSDGSTVVVGESQYNPRYGMSVGPGKVYVFVRPTGGWSGQVTESAQLTASDGISGEALGSSVSISGNTIVAGAPGMLPPYAQSGAAYVFAEPASGWKTSTQTAKLTTTDGAGHVGTSVSISGNTVAVGAPYHLTDLAGTVDLFVEPPGGWVDMTQTAELISSGKISGGLMGSSVAIEGPIVVAGGPQATVGTNQYEGAVYIFVEPAGGWKNMTQATTLTEPGGKAGDAFGTAVAMTADTIVVGSPYYARGPNLNFNGPAFWNEGASYAFTKTASGWRVSKMHGADARYEDLLGSSVGISGSTVVVGAPYLGHDSGSTYVFELQ